LFRLFADHRMTNPRHIRITQIGEIKSLESFMDSLSYNPEIEDDYKRAKQTFHEHNQRVGKQLQAKGLA